MAVLTYTGGAAALPDVYTITVGGTWVAGDTPTIQIGNRVLQVTVGSTVTTAKVAAQLAAAINAQARGDMDTIDGYSVNFAPQTAGEFAEVDAVADGSVVTITGPTDKPVYTAGASTITAVDNSTAGTLTVSRDQTATGPRDWSNGKNWDTGSAPVDSDSLVYKDTSVGPEYGLPDDASPLESTSIHVYKSFTGRIGKPPINIDDQRKPYAEYRPTFATINDYLTTDSQHTFGIGAGSGSPLINLHLAATNGNNITVRVYGTGAPQHSGKALNLYGSNSGTYTWEINGGSIAIGDKGSATKISTLSTSYQLHPSNELDLLLGDTATLSAANLIFGGGTILIIQGSAISSLRGHEGLVNISPASDTSYTITSALTVEGATVSVRGQLSVTGTAKISAGLLDLDRGAGAVSFTNPVELSGGVYRDNNGRAPTVVIDRIGGVYELGPRHTVTRSNI